MAIGHFSVKGGSRAKGRSAYSHFRYLLREGAQYQDRVHDLSYVRHENYPSWALENPGTFWKSADLYERANARLYTEFEIALPRELSKQDNIELLEGFLDELFYQDRHPYTAVIHTSVALDGGRNPHAHVMFSERSLADGVERDKETFFSRANGREPEKGGAAKNREWNKKHKVAELRKRWEVSANLALEFAGSKARITMQSLHTQGVDRDPEPKLGPSRTAMYKQGIVTEVAQEVIQRRLVVSKEKERTQLRHALGRAKIAQYQQKQAEKTVEISASEVLGMVKKAKRDLYDALERSEKTQYELGGFKSRGAESIRFHATNDPFLLSQREKAVALHERYEENLKSLKQYEKELIVVGEMTLEVREKSNWTHKSAVVNEREFDNAVGRAQGRQFEQSLKHGKELRRVLSREKK